jgi:hypothetical protein
LENLREPTFFHADLHGKNPLINWCGIHAYNLEICAPFSAKISVNLFFTLIYTEKTR